MNIKTEEVRAFVNYGYIPFSKIQCIKRLLFMWATAWIPCIMSKHRTVVSVIILACVLAITWLFLGLIRQRSEERESRFLCDAVTFTYHAIVLNNLAYQVLRRMIGVGWLAQIAFLLILFLGIVVVALNVYRRVKHDGYSVGSKSSVSITLPVVGGVAGVFAAKLLLPAADETILPIILATILLLLSLGIGIGSLSFVKWLIVHKNRELF